MKCLVSSRARIYGFVLFYAFISVFVFVESSSLSVLAQSEDDSVVNSTLLDDDSIEKRTEKRSSSLHAIPSSSSLLLKDEDISMMDRIQIPIIYHAPLASGKAYGGAYKSELGAHNYVLNGRPNMKTLRKPSTSRHHGFQSGRHQSIKVMSDQGPQVFPVQNPFPPVVQHNSYDTYSTQSFQPPHFSSSAPSSQTISSSDPKHPDLLYYQNFDKLCPASKPYPVYIEKKVPITIEKRVPYPVKVPYPVHHYHYDNVEHRNINAEDLKNGAPPPPPVKDSKPPPKVGGLFTGGDKGGFKGDTKEEMYEAYDENNGGERHDDEYEETYGHYEKTAASREIPREVTRVKPTGGRRNVTPRTNNHQRSRNNNNNNRLNKRNNNQQNKKNVNNNESRSSNERKHERTPSLIIKAEDNDNEDNKTIERIVLPSQSTTTVVGLRSENKNSN